MNHFVKFGLTGLLALILVGFAAGVSRAEEITCQGFLGAVTVDNLRVPQNGSCTLRGTKVEGTIKVENGASLTAWQVRVMGNVQAEGAAVVRVLAGSTVGGSIQLKQGGAAQVDQVQVNADIQYESNSGILSATRNQVGGNVQVFQNTGGVIIKQNMIDGNLQCKENTPPHTGGNNIVQGNKEDQCANLQPGDTTPPETTPLTGPPATTPAFEATFTFTGSDTPTPSSLLLFECALDSAAFQPCDSPHTVQGLTPGQHTLQVRALDMALNLDSTPASYTWSIQSSSGAAPTTKIYLPFLVRN